MFLSLIKALMSFVIDGLSGDLTGKYIFNQALKIILKCSNNTLEFVQAATKSNEISHIASLNWANHYPKGYLRIRCS